MKLALIEVIVLTAILSNSCVIGGGGQKTVLMKPTLMIIVLTAIPSNSCVIRGGSQKRVMMRRVFMKLTLIEALLLLATL